MDKSQQGEVLFRETQWFQPRWLWGLVLGVAAVDWYLGVDRGWLFSLSHHLPYFVSLLVLGVLAPLFLFTYRQVTEVRRDGIHLKRAPFPRSLAVIRFSEFYRYQPRVCSPIYAAGGWGIAAGWQGKAFNMGGANAVELCLVTGERVLIGSGKQRQLLDTLHFVCQPKRKRPTDDVPAAA